MTAIFNVLPFKEGAADDSVDRFAARGGHVQGFVSIEVLKSDAGDEVLVVTRWRNREAFEAWVHSDEFAKVDCRGGGSGLLRDHPQMDTYEISVRRGPEAL